MDAFTEAHVIAAQVRAAELSAVEVLEDALARIEAHNKPLNAFTALDPDGARAQAKAVDAAVAAGRDPGLLAGVPIGVKDLEPAAGLPWTSGSVAFKDQVAEVDSVQVGRLRAAGAVVVGKTNTPEFGYKGFTDNLLYGPTRNPWNLERTSGGSSGGSAAAVTAGLVPLATASDGGGSIRIPAAFCGCFGLKPSTGRVPRGDPSVPLWGSLSHRGPVSRTVRDAARYLDVVAGPHPDDLDSMDSPPGGFEAAVLGPPPSIRRVGWSADLGYAAVDQEVRRIAADAAHRLAEALGAELVEADPGFPNPGADWAAIAAPGDTWFLDSLTAEQKAVMEPGFLAFASGGRKITGTRYVAALAARHQLNRTINAYLAEYELLLTPAVAVTAFGAQGPPPAVIDGRAVAPFEYTPFTYPMNMTGHPAASLPAGRDSGGLPVGLQVVGPRHADALVLAVAAAFEAAHPWEWPPAP